MLEWLLEDPNVQELMQSLAAELQGRVLEARVILRKVLAARSLPVTGDVRARIESESDLAQLESWLDAALTASTIDDVFPPVDRAR